MRKVYLETLTDVEALSPSEYENVIFGIPHAWMCISRPLEQLGGFYSFSVYTYMQPRKRK
jgi:hypothetical protein